MSLQLTVCLLIEYADDGLGTLFTDESDFSSVPKLVATASADFQRRENFLRGCLWSVPNCLIFTLCLSKKFIHFIFVITFQL